MEASKTERPAAALFAGAALLGLLLSTEYLFQPFVWRHWPWDEVMHGWLEILRDRLTVAAMIALALLLAWPVRLAGLRESALLLAAAILLGATAGELLLLAAGSLSSVSDLASLAGRVARWGVAAGSVASMWYLWRRTVESRAAEQAVQLRRLQLQRQATELQLEALRSQIEPHFLFNTLATVRRLRLVEPRDGARLLACFVDYLRSAREQPAGEGLTLGREVDMAQAYLRVIEVRMAGQLRLRFDVPEALRSHPFPPLSLLTLVENAVQHGIEPAMSGGLIEVSAARRGDQLELVVADNGQGLQGTGGSGIGLANIRARLTTLHGDAASLSLKGNTPRGVRATLRLPWRDGCSG